MKKEIPEFLIEMSKQINEQNNRVTADPIFEVRHKEYLVTEDGYNESHWVIINDDGDELYHSEKSEDYTKLAEFIFHEDLEWAEDWFNDLDEDLDFTWDNFKHSFNDSFLCDWTDLPDGLRKLHMQEIEVTVNSHFTEADAQAFIDRKQHDYPKLYIYANSLCYCENMIKLRNWIKILND